MKKNYDNRLKSNKVIQSQKMPKKCPKNKICSWKIQKGAGIFENLSK